MADIILLKMLYAAANEARRQMMGLYSDGPFSRVSFVLTRFGIEMRVPVRRLECRGTLVATIQNEI